MTEPLRHIYSMAHILMLENRPDVLTSAASYPFSWHKKSPAISGGARQGAH
ncbi:hypothetical protein STM14_4598 [Salmonella enterica subsp. enterica serovar Typhimurium str. 14028S]|uniref:Uncharacterized protein n=1 Tax=Salmonella typhimurium (strain 14028s / SGSC 2262) TaxID=588858 RepID=A0A0F6B8X4_SALT1|nr:hypothetical protein STM14_4598 [Salmonella enterica subsp. enterica serovar Typhimurium str. 14028S]